MIVACLEKYGNLGCLIQDGSYYVPPAVDDTEFDMANDHYGIEKARLLKAYESRD